VTPLPSCSSPSVWLALVALAALAAGCAQKPVAAPNAPVKPPTPASVTRQHPGGDAEDPHRAALERLLAEPWGARSDKDEQLKAPMPDWENWRRLRFWGFDHLVGFRYGKEYHAVSAIRVQVMPSGTPVRSETCMRAFEAWARPQIQGFDVKLSPFGTKLARWRNQPLVIQTVDGWVSWGLSSAEFSVAWTAYPAYPDACLIYGIGVQWKDQPEAAKRVRDRFVNEGFAGLETLTPDKPFRHPPDKDAPPPFASPKPPAPAEAEPAR
jgi:hypothetical protein